MRRYCPLPAGRVVRVVRALSASQACSGGWMLRYRQASVQLSERANVSPLSSRDSSWSPVSCRPPTALLDYLLPNLGFPRRGVEDPLTQLLTNKRQILVNTCWGLGKP